MPASVEGSEEPLQELPLSTEWDENPALGREYAAIVERLASKHNATPEQVVAASVRLVLATNPVSGPGPTLLAIWGTEFSVVRGPALRRLAHALGDPMREVTVPADRKLADELGLALRGLACTYDTPIEVVLVHGVKCMELLDQVVDSRGALLVIVDDGRFEMRSHSPLRVSLVDMSLGSALRRLRDHSAL